MFPSPSKPEEEQKLIYCGKLLLDHQHLEDFLPQVQKYFIFCCADVCQACHERFNFPCIYSLAGGVACSSFGVQPQGSRECARNQLRGTKLMPCFESLGCRSLLMLQVFPANALAVLLVIRWVSSVRTYLDQAQK